MDLADVGLADRLATCGEGTDIAERVAMADRFEVVLERLAADRDPLFEHDRGLAARQGVALDRVRAPGQLDIVPFGQRLETTPGQRTQAVEAVFLRPQLFAPFGHHRSLNRRAGRH